MRPSFWMLLLGCLALTGCGTMVRSIAAMFNSGGQSGSWSSEQQTAYENDPYRQLADSVGATYNIPTASAPSQPKRGEAE